MLLGDKYKYLPIAYIYMQLGLLVCLKKVNIGYWESVFFDGLRPSNIYLHIMTGTNL